MAWALGFSGHSFPLAHNGAFNYNVDTKIPFISKLRNVNELSLGVFGQNFSLAHNWDFNYNDTFKF